MANHTTKVAKASVGGGSRHAKPVAAAAVEAVESRTLMSITPVPVGPEALVNADQATAGTVHVGGADRAVASDRDGNYVVVWQDRSGRDGSGEGMFARLFAADGTPKTPSFAVNLTTAGNQGSGSVAMEPDGGSFVVAWEGDVQLPKRVTDTNVFARRFTVNADGTLTGGTEFRVNTTTANTQWRPAVGMDDGGNFVVAWTSNLQDPPTSANRKNPNYGGSNGVYAQRFGADDRPRGGEFRVNTYLHNSQYLPSVAMNAAGQFVVTWTSTGNAYEGYAVGQDGSYTGVYAKRFDAAGNVLPSPLGASGAGGGEFRVNTVTEFAQTESSVAIYDDGSFVCAYGTNYPPEGGQMDILAQRFAPDGSRAGAEFLVNTPTADDQRQPHVTTLSDGGFLVAWQSYDFQDFDAYARRYDAAGAPAGGEFRLSDRTAGKQMYAYAAATPGGFVAVWGGDGTGEVYARRFTLPADPAPQSTLGDTPVADATAGGADQAENETVAEQVLG